MLQQSKSSICHGRSSAFCGLQPVPSCSPRSKLGTTWSRRPYYMQCELCWRHVKSIFHVAGWRVVVNNKHSILRVEAMYRRYRSTKQRTILLIGHMRCDDEECRPWLRRSGRTRHVYALVRTFCSRSARARGQGRERRPEPPAWIIVPRPKLVLKQQIRVTSGLPRLPTHLLSATHSLTRTRPLSSLLTSPRSFFCIPLAWKDDRWIASLKARCCFQSTR